VLHLINACTHHYWRFRNGARELLDAQLEVSSFRNILLTIYPKLSQTDKDYLTRISFIISEEKK
jgi:aminopeptidase N